MASSSGISGKKNESDRNQWTAKGTFFDRQGKLNGSGTIAGTNAEFSLEGMLKETPSNLTESDSEDEDNTSKTYVGQILVTVREAKKQKAFAAAFSPEASAAPTTSTPKRSTTKGIHFPKWQPALSPIEASDAERASIVNEEPEVEPKPEGAVDFGEVSERMRAAIKGQQVAVRRGHQKPSKKVRRRVDRIVPMTKVKAAFRKNTTQRLTKEAAVYAGAVLEYLTAEVVEGAGLEAQKNDRKRITPEHIRRSLLADDEMSRFLELSKEATVIPMLDGKTRKRRRQRQRTQTRKKQRLESVAEETRNEE